MYESDDHPNIATALSNVAFYYSKLGDYEKALLEYMKVLGNNGLNSKNYIS